MEVCILNGRWNGSIEPFLDVAKHESVRVEMMRVD